MNRLSPRFFLTASAFATVLLGTLATLDGCSGSDDTDDKQQVPPATLPACDACSSATLDGSADASRDGSSAPAPDASGDDDDDAMLACQGSFASVCTDASCIPTYSAAAKATSFCGTNATEVTEFPAACQGYNYVSVVANGVTTNYYYDGQSGAAVAAVIASDGGQTCTGSTSSGSVPVSPCDFGGAVTMLDEVCAGVADAGADAH